MKKKIIDVFVIVLLAYAAICIANYCDPVYEALWWLIDWMDENTILEEGVYQGIILVPYMTAMVILLGATITAVSHIRVSVRIVPFKQTKKVAKPVKA